jgi:hypothetical protein
MRRIYEFSKQASQSNNAHAHRPLNADRLCKGYLRRVMGNVISQTLSDFGDNSEARSRIKDSGG